MIPKRLKIAAGSHPENLPYNSFGPGLTDRVSQRGAHLTWMVKTRHFHQKDGHVFAYACVTLCDFGPQGMLIRACSSHYLLESSFSLEISKHGKRAGGSLTLSITVLLKLILNS